MAEPIVISSHAQPTSLSTRNTSHPLEYRLGYVLFTGNNGVEEHTIEVLADEAAPTPSAGYGKWTHIPRPQRAELTVFEGFAPMALSVPILFDAVRENGIREDVENEIQWLEWMGGRGIKFSGASPKYKAAFGRPPLVEVFSRRGAATASKLIPEPFQTENILWYVDDIAFDEHPLRSPGSARIRQAAVVKLVQYVTDPSPSSGNEGPRYKSFPITRSLNTVEKLVRAHVKPKSKAKGLLHNAVKATLQENEFNKRVGHSPTKNLYHKGKPLSIRIPSRYLSLHA